MSNITSSNFNLTQPLPNLLPLNFLLTSYNFSTLITDNTTQSPTTDLFLDETRDKSREIKDFDKLDPFNQTKNKLSLFSALVLSKLPVLPFNFTVFPVNSISTNATDQVDINILLDHWLFLHPEKEEVVRIIRQCIEHKNKILNLSGLNLQVLDDTLIEILSRLNWVTTLRLTANGLREIPAHAFTHMKQLTSLFLNHNQLNYLPSYLFSSLTSLNNLSLSNNQLTQIPLSAFSQLEQLNNLFLDHNHLTQLHPNLFSHLLNLSNLNLSSNNLETLPETLFLNQTQLFFLFLEENSFTELPSGIFDRLALNAALHLDSNLRPHFYAALPQHLHVYRGGYPLNYNNS